MTIPKTHVAWTTGEERILEEKYPLYGSKIPELCNHTQYAITTRAMDLEIQYVREKKHKRRFSQGGKWEEWEEDEIKDHYPYYGSKIESLSHRSPNTIRTKANKMGIKYEGKYYRRIT